MLLAAGLQLVSDPRVGGESAAGAAFAGPVGEGEGAVNILAWPGYVEDGSTDPAVDWVTPFEKQTGCKVNRQDVRHLGRGRQADAGRRLRRRLGLG